MSRHMRNVIRRGLPYSPSPCFPNPSVDRFSSIVKAVEGDKRMGGYAAKIRGVR